VTLDAGRSSGSGTLAKCDFSMSRRGTVHADASFYLEGCYDLWLPSDRSWAGFLSFYAGGSGYVEYVNGWSSDEVLYSIAGHTVFGEVKGQGELSMQFAPDGTVALAAIGRAHFDVWRREATEATLSTE